MALWYTIVIALEALTQWNSIVFQVACKYIENPVLFHREDVGHVKFDVRYLVLISSAKPLVLHADKVFWLRFANQWVFHTVNPKVEMRWIFLTDYHTFIWVPYPGHTRRRNLNTLFSPCKTHQMF